MDEKHKFAANLHIFDLYPIYTHKLQSTLEMERKIETVNQLIESLFIHSFIQRQHKGVNGELMVFLLMPICSKLFVTIKH